MSANRGSPKRVSKGRGFRPHRRALINDLERCDTAEHWQNDNLVMEAFSTSRVVDLVIFFQRAERPFSGRVCLQLRESKGIVQASSEAIYDMDSGYTRQTKHGLFRPDKIPRFHRQSHHVLVRHTCESCRFQMSQRDIRLETEFRDNGALIAADSARLQQVLRNVLENAVKFSLEKGTINVTRGRQAGGPWEVRVRDSGIGIPAEAMPGIFDAFEQAGVNVTRQYGGLGFGLAVCKALVELDQGSIRAESVGPGEGSTFIIELPGRSGGRCRWHEALRLCSSGRINWGRYGPSHSH
jgi:signal transduction histidine kinase